MAYASPQTYAKFENSKEAAQPKLRETVSGMCIGH